MSATVATHDGPFHADDVMAFALLRTFADANAVVVRTRDMSKIEASDFVIDVGGIYDPDAGRFDHHQASYQGPLSAAGMVLHWLHDANKIDGDLYATMRDGFMTYLDGVDNGRVAPKPDVPCFPRIVEALNAPATTHREFDAGFDRAVAFAEAWLQGLLADHARRQQARAVVAVAMEDAKNNRRNVLLLDAYLPWKGAYFAANGASHPTEYVLYPSTDGHWRIVAIPPAMGDFAQKRSLPESWAGKTDEDLEAVTGIAGAIFCHKNRFIAVFRTREAAVQALKSTNRWDR